MKISKQELAHLLLIVSGNSLLKMDMKGPYITLSYLRYLVDNYV